MHLIAPLMATLALDGFDATRTMPWSWAVGTGFSESATLLPGDQNREIRTKVRMLIIVAVAVRINPVRIFLRRAVAAKRRAGRGMPTGSVSAEVRLVRAGPSGSVSNDGSEGMVGGGWRKGGTPELGSSWSSLETSSASISRSWNRTDSRVPASWAFSIWETFSSLSLKIVCMKFRSG